MAVTEPIETVEPIELEQRGWQALSTSGERAAAFYEDVLDGTVVMLLPGGTRLDDRAMIVASMSGAPWSSHRLEDVRVLNLTGDAAVVTYGVVAARQGQPEYSALVSSAYVRRDGGWKLAFHQQTPR